MLGGERETEEGARRLNALQIATRDNFFGEKKFMSQIEEAVSAGKVSVLRGRRQCTH